LDQELIPYCYFVFLLGGGDAVADKSLRFRHVKSDCNEIWQDCSSSKYTSLVSYDSKLMEKIIHRSTVFYCQMTSQ